MKQEGVEAEDEEDMKPKELVALGIPRDCIDAAVQTIKETIHSLAYGSKHKVEQALIKVVADPEQHVEDDCFGKLAKAMIASKVKTEEETKNYANNPYGQAKGFAQWGDDIDPNAINQMKFASNLPVAVQGALMPDYHLGYGLPIGGVLATYDSVLPMAVGVDIACRMMLTITDLSNKLLEDVFSPKVDPLIRAITGGTVFGVGGRQKIKANAPVMDMDWNITAITKRMHDRAWEQLGTSGSGNHFVEWGLVTLDHPDLGLEPGTYVALLSHSGSRGAGAAVCQEYKDIAIDKLPKAYEQFKNLAWLSLQSEAGQEYWNAMNLMGEYASANHRIIHERVLKLMGAKSIAVVENHHNFAWKERHGDRDLIVHRKGATPAGAGVLGVIPGSMADPAFVVRGKGKIESLRSASHGAGRVMSRTQALKKFNWADWKSIIQQRQVRLLSAGLDEVPGVYKPIHKVMAAQTDLVDIVAQYDPKIVKMSDDGRSED